MISRKGLVSLFWMGLVVPIALGQARDAVSVELPEAVELAMVIAVVSDLDPEGQMIVREGVYVEAIEAHFAQYAEHPLFGALGAKFNLPRLAGNAADFAFDGEAHLIEVDTSGSLWGDREGDLFRRHLQLIDDFAKQSDFLSFYEKHGDYYAVGIEAKGSETDTQAMTAWLETNFTARPGPMQIIVSPLIGGLNWTTLYKPQTRMWVAPSSAKNSEKTSHFDRVFASYAIFTELNHSYVNPATKDILEQVEAAFGVLRDWAHPGSSASSYKTPELQFNEYMTWTVYLMWASDQLDEAQFAKLKENFVSFMAEQRGFIKFSEFADTAIQHTKEDDLTAEEVMLIMVKWALESSKIEG